MGHTTITGFISYKVFFSIILTLTSAENQQKEKGLQMLIGKFKYPCLYLATQLLNNAQKQGQRQSKHSFSQTNEQSKTKTDS